MEVEWKIAFFQKKRRIVYMMVINDFFFSDL